MSESYRVVDRRIIQLLPAPRGLRAVYDASEPLVVPLIAIALCRCRDKHHRLIDGALLSTSASYTEVCGLETGESGFEICEEAGNLLGYLDETEEPSQEWLRLHGAREAIKDQEKLEAHQDQEHP